MTTLIARLQHFGSAAMLLGLCNCNPVSTTGSESKSLDNVARAPGAALTVNQCGIDYTGKETLPAYVTALNAAPYINAADTASRNAVLGALAVVPKPLLAEFFVLAKGRIEVGSTAACSSTPFTAEERELAGNTTSVPACWRQPEGGQPLRILLAANPKLIRFSLLRLFAFVHAEYFVTRLQDPAAPAPFNDAAWQTALSGFTTERDAIGTAFLHDLTGEAHDRLAKMQAADPVAYGNLIYANTVDSYFCTSDPRDPKNTRTQFSTRYKETWAAFTNTASEHSPLRQLAN